MTATARKIAVLFYNAIRFGTSYQDPGADHYECRYRERVVKQLHRRAAEFGFTLQAVAVQSVSYESARVLRDTTKSWRYTFMSAHLERRSMAALCDGLQVSRSGYYAWCKRGATAPLLDVAVRTVYEAHACKVGAPYVAAEIQVHGIQASQRTVGRSLCKQGLKAKVARKFRHTTDSKHKHPVSPNLLQRQFAVSQPNQVWVGDITYLQTTQGWLYLAVMIDLFSRQVVGWQMSHRIDQALVNDALRAALVTRGRPQGVMVHTDQGSQYCAASYRAIIKGHRLVQSMSRKGNCRDNAVAKSFFATLKKQSVHGQTLTKREAIIQNIFEYIEIYYTRVRGHSANNWVSPVDFERLHNQTLEGRTVH